MCSSDVYKNMKNINFGEFIDLKYSTNFKHNLKTDMYLFYNKEDKEKFENIKYSSSKMKVRILVDAIPTLVQIHCILKS